MNNNIMIVPLGRGIVSVELLEFIMNSDYDNVSRCLERDVTPNFQFGCFTPLIQAIMLQDLKMVRILINGNADVNYDNGNSTPLREAIKTRNIEIIRTLLNSGADPNLQSPLVNAVEKGNVDIVKELLYRGANVESSVRLTGPKVNALGLAILLKKYDIAVELMNFGGKTVELSELKTDVYSFCRDTYRENYNFIKMIIKLPEDFLTQFKTLPPFYNKNGMMIFPGGEEYRLAEERFNK